MEDFGKVNPIYAGYLKEPYPARETICVKALPLGSEIEISMIAAK
jgi:2-iminobutanoate/2-iminopropanoate deaminase